MGYSEDSSMVRVDFFTDTGKWYCTEAVKWTGAYKDSLIHNSFAKSLHDHLVKTDSYHTYRDKKQYRLTGMVAICLEPYHEYSLPITLDVDDIDKYR